MSNDVLITPASRKIEFKDSSANVDAKIETDASGNLIITNTGGDISIGDTTSDIFVGDGTANVDIVFEQSGEIRGETGVTVTLGAADSSIRMATDLNLNSNDITNAGTINAANLNISGTTTTISSTNTTITDSIIELNSGLTVANSKDIGFVFERGSTGNNAAFIWDESADRFTVITTTGTASDDTLSGTAANFQAGSFYGNGANLTSLNGTNISSGTVAAARIANLDASKITSGLIGGARLATGSSGDWWSGNAVKVGTDGVIEIGKYIDFHNADAGTSDYTARITNTGDHLYATGRLYVNSNQRVFADDYHPNADTWTTARTITLGGDLTGNVSINGSANVTLTAAVVDDSHNHVLANVDRVVVGGQNLNDYNTQSIISWGSSQPTNGPGYAYATGFVLQDNNQPQQLVQVYGGNANKVKLYGRRKTSGSWDTTWTQYFSDHYHPNADTLTTARTINGVSFNGSANITVADSTKLPLAGGTMTGNLSVPQLLSTSNGAGTNVKIGDDAWIGDINVANTIRISGVQNANNGYISFGNSSNTALGRAGTGNLTWGTDSVYHEGYHPNADILTTARTISLGGDVTGSASFNGSSNITITAAVADDSHNHVISNVDGLQSALDGKLDTSFDHAESHKTWTGINAASTQAKRYHVARLYGCPAHWDSNWQNIEFTVTAESYESGYLKFRLMGDYGGAGSQANMIKVFLTEAHGPMIGRFQFVLGSPVDAGWDHSGQDTFYVDLYAEAAHYSQWKINAKNYGHGYQTSNPSSGGATTVFYTSPTTTNTSTFDVDYDDTYIRGNKIWNELNHGSGSGLDADKLDNQEGSYYLNYNNLNNKPTIPTNTNYYLDGITKSGNTLTFSVNGTTNQTYAFGSNAFNSTTIPTNNNQLTNGAGYLTSVPNHSAALITSGTLNNARLTDLFKAGTEIPSAANLNSYRTTGYYSQNSNNDAAAGSNYPASLAGMLEVITDDTGNGIHTLQRYARYNNNDTFNRYYYNGTWTSWRKEWNSLNDGASSGLDADLLDAQEGSYYLNYNNFSNIPTNRVLKDSLTANSTSSITTFVSQASMATASGGQSGLQVYRGTSGQDAFMTFHVGGDFACYLGLDGGTNKLSVGGWSMGANSYEIYHSGNKPSLATLGFTGASNANYITNNNQLTNGASYITASNSAITNKLPLAGGTITGSLTVNGTYFADTSQQKVKYSVWSGSTYGIGMHNAITYGGLNDYGMTFQMNSESDRGFWWGDSSHTLAQGAMSLTTHGYLTVANRVRIGYGESDTTTPTIELEVSGKAGFVAAGNSNRGNIIMGATGSGSSKWAALAATHYNDATGSGNGSGAAGCMVIGNFSDASANRVYIGGGPYELNPATEIRFYTHTATTHSTGGSQAMIIDTNGNLLLNNDLHIDEYIYHAGDTNTYIRVQADSWIFRTGGNDRLTINNGGVTAGDNISLGGNQLENIGNAYFNEYLYHNGDTDTYIRFNSDDIRIRTGGGDRIIVNNTLNYSQVPLEIKCEGGNTATDGGRFLSVAYSGNNRIATMSSQYSSGDLCIGNGLSFDQGNTGLVSTFGNFSRPRSGILVNGGSIEIVGTSGSVQTAVDSAVTAPTRHTFNTQNGNYTATGDVTAFSDERLKDDIKVIDNAVEKVKQVRGVTFTRNDLKDNRRHAGVIAQEVEKVLPEVVLQSEDTKTVAYGNMVGLLIEAIKEQQETIEKLTSRINDIEKGE